jgi:antitoxin HicB
MKTLEEYLALPYTMMVKWSADDQLYVARVKEIERCTGHGDNEAEALAMLRDNLRDWVAFCLEAGDQVPVPSELEHLPSGKWLQRVPKSLHKRVIECAEADGVSLNAFVTVCLSRVVGMAEIRHARRNGGRIFGLDARAAAADRLTHHRKSLDITGYIDIPGSAAYTCSVARSHDVFSTGGNFTSPQFLAFVNQVADQLPIHCTSSNSERTVREEKEKYKKSAYA